MRTSSVAAAALVLAALHLAACSRERAPDVELVALDGSKVRPFATDAAGPRVFLFVRNDCPVANRSAPEIERLWKSFGPRGVQFALVHVDPDETPEAIEAHRKEYGLTMPAYRDPSHALVRACGAEVTPEAAAYDAKGRLAYRGRIDDRVVDYGTARPEAVRRDLEVALEEMLSGRKPGVPRTPAVGCLIADVAPRAATTASPATARRPPGPPPDPVMPPETMPEPRPPGTLTFAKDVAPIVHANCAPCHHQGAVAPFALVTHEDVRKRARQVVKVTQSGFMPPWLPDRHVSRFEGERGLSASQKAILKQWSEEGAILGDPKDLPPAPSFPKGWQLGDPDLVVTFTEPYELAAEGSDVFRNFVIPDVVPSSRRVKGLEFRLDNAWTVHHAEIRLDETGESLERDLETPEPGYDGMDADTAHYPEGHFVNWVPGKTPAFLPAGLSWPLEANADLVIQLHMISSGKPEKVSPRIGLFFTEEVPANPPQMIWLGALDFVLEAGERDRVVRDEFRLPVDADLLALLPHAHFLGRSVRAWATLPDGTQHWLLRIGDWDFAWQDDYRFATPMSLPAGTLLSLEFTYDNSPANPRNPSHPPQRVAYGPKSADEMCDLWIQARPRSPSDRPALRQAFLKHRLQRKIERDEAEVAREPSAVAHVRLARHLREAGDPVRALEQARRAVTLEPDRAAWHAEVAEILLQSGDLEGAITAHEAAVASDPSPARRLVTHAGLLQRAGRQDEAIEALERAVEADPASAQARFDLGRALVVTARASEALERFEEALRLDPRNAHVAHAVARQRATHPDAARRDPARAVALARQALESKPDEPRFLGTLAAAQAAGGNFALAMASAETAVALARARADARLVAQLEWELSEYRASRALIEGPPPRR